MPMETMPMIEKNGRRPRQWWWLATSVVWFTSNLNEATFKTICFLL